MLFAATDLWCGAPPAGDDDSHAGSSRGVDRSFQPDIGLPAVRLDPAERALVRDLADTDSHTARQAFESLYQTYAPALARFAYGYVRSRSESEDLVSDVFLAVWVRRATWEPRYGIRAYLYAAIRHRALNNRRADQRAIRHLGEFATSRSEAVAPPADVALDAHDRRARLTAAIAALPEEARRLAELRWHQGMSPAEIAAVLGINRAAVDNRLSRLLRRLQALVR